MTIRSWDYLRSSIAWADGLITDKQGRDYFGNLDCASERNNIFLSNELKYCNNTDGVIRIPWGQWKMLLSLTEAWNILRDLNLGRNGSINFVVYTDADAVYPSSPIYVASQNDIVKTGSYGDRTHDLVSIYDPVWKKTTRGDYNIEVNAFLDGKRYSFDRY